MKCTHITNGKRCNGNATKEGEYCYMHSLTPAQRREVSAKGGSSSDKGLVLAEDINLASLVSDKHMLELLICDTMLRVRKVRPTDGGITPQIANCLGFLAGKLMDIRTNTKIEERIQALEETVHGNASK